MGDTNTNSQMPKVNEAIVIRHIENALAKETGGTVNEKVGKAFRALQSKRRSNEWVDPDLAAAEHYLYARFLAGITGDPIVSQAPRFYNIKKKIFFALEIENLMTTSKYPCLPPTEESVVWGERGALDGLKDFKYMNPSTDFKVGEALKPLAGSVY
jgi:hypothetical protein